jgi:hypothetical protein
MRCSKFLLTISIFSLLAFLPLAASSQDVKPRFGQPNMGVTDRLIRTGLGIGLAAWGTAALADKHDMGAVPLGLGVISLVTVATGRCPFYYLFGIDTREKKHGLSLNWMSRGAGLTLAYHF